MSQQEKAPTMSRPLAKKSEPMPSIASQSLRARREAVVTAHIEAESIKHDAAATGATFRHPRYEIIPLGVIADGKEAVEDLLKQLFVAFPDLKIETSALHQSENAIIVECRLTGTHRGPWTGIAASGRRMDLPCVVFFIFDGENLMCERVYYDQATILRQLSVVASA